MKNLHGYRFKRGREFIFICLEEKIHLKEDFCDFNHGFHGGDDFLQYLRGKEFLDDCIFQGIHGVSTKQIGTNRGNTRVFFDLPPKRISSPQRDPRKLWERLKKQGRIII